MTLKSALTNGSFKPFIKAIAEYEFSGDNDVFSITRGATFEASQKGFSGGARLGFDYKASENFNLNLGAEQIFGKRDEIAAKLGVVFKF